MFDYVRLNPYKLALRKAYPDYFTRLRNLSLTLDIGTACHPSPVTFQAYGNLQLLTNPFKEPVAVHRADKAEQTEKSAALKPQPALTRSDALLLNSLASALVKWHR